MQYSAATCLGLGLYVPDVSYFVAFHKSASSWGQAPEYKQCETWVPWIRQQLWIVIKNCRGWAKSMAECTVRISVCEGMRRPHKQLANRLFMSYLRVSCLPRSRCISTTHSRTQIKTSESTSFLCIARCSMFMPAWGTNVASDLEFSFFRFLSSS
jgi:hypothetical protein